MILTNLRLKSIGLLAILLLLTTGAGCKSKGGASGAKGASASSDAANNNGNPTSSLSQITLTSPSTNPYLANAASITVSGTCTTNATVFISGAYESNTLCVNSTFSFLVSPPALGDLVFQLYQSNRNFISSTPLKFTWKRDSSLPISPVITSPIQPYYSNLNSVTIQGTCTSGYTVEMSGADSGSTTCASNVFSFTSSKSSDAAYEYSFLQKNQTGTDSGSVNFIWNRDTVAPSAPTITQPVANPYSTTNNNLTLSGACENDATVSLSGSSTDSATCSGNAYSFAITKSSDGTFQFNLVQTDRAGNASPITEFIWNRDNTPPAALTINNHTSPFTSNSSSLMLTGNCESGASVNVTGDATLSTSCINSLYSVTIPKSTDGTYQFQLNQTDAAGMSSPNINFIWIRDTVAPNALTITNPASSPYSSSNANLSVSGTCETDAKVNVSGDATAVTNCTAGSFTFTINKSVDGTYNFSLNQTDAALNSSASVTLQWLKTSTAPAAPVITSPTPNPYTSSESSITIAGTCISSMAVEMSGDATGTTTCINGAFQFPVSKASDGSYQFNFRQMNSENVYSSAATFTWIRDTSPPAAPTITTPATNPFYSNQNTLTISGGCVSGNKVSISGDTSSTDTTCTAGNTYSFTVNKSSDASYSFQLTQSDASGNVSPTTSLTWIRDTLSPAALTITTPINNPYASSDNSVTLAGACEAAASISVSGAETTSATCTGSGTYSVSLSQTSDGTYHYTLKQTDRAGNVSADLLFTWNRTTALPFTPVITVPAVSPYISNNNSVTITATCDIGYSPSQSVVTLSGDATATQTCHSSPVSFVVPKSTDGSYQFQVKQTNPNNSTDSAYATQQWIRDTAAPAAPTLTSPASSPYTASGNLTIQGGCEANATVSLSGDATQSTACNAGGTYSFTVNKSVDASYQFSIAQTDQAGNASTSTSLNWIRFSGTIDPPVITTPATSPLTNNSSALTIAGTCTAGYTVTLSGDSSDSQTCSGGAFSFTINKTSDSTYQFSLKQSTGGIQSTAATQTWTRDTTPPVVTLSSNPGTTNLKLTAGFSFSSNESGSTFECKLDTDAAYSSCNSPLTLDPVTNGSRSLSIQATDPAGNTSTAVTHHWSQKGYKTIALYHFNSAAPASDSSTYTTSAGYSNNLTFSTSPGPGNDTSTGALPTASPQGRYLSVGYTYYANSNDVLKLGLDKMTIEGRVKYWSVPAGTSYFTLISKTGASGDFGWEVRFRKISPSTYCYDFVVSQNGTTISTASSNTFNPTQTAFQYFAITWNLGTVNFFYGNSAPTAAGSGTIGTPGSATIFPSTARLRIGANQTTGSSPSTAATIGIDEFRISQTIRTPAATTSEFVAD